MSVIALEALTIEASELVLVSKGMSFFEKKFKGRIKNCKFVENEITH